MPIYSPDRHTCAPSYVKLTRQPITGGTYRPLADDEDSNACAPSTLSCHHSSKLYTQKSAIHATYDNANVFIPKVDAPHPSETTDGRPANEATNDNIRPVPPSTELQLAQADEHPLMQTVEVCKKAAHTTAKTLSAAGHAVAKAAKTTGHAIHVSATAVKTAWHTFINFKAVQPIIKFFKKACSLWKKRMKFSYAFYTAVFALLTSAEVIFLQWGFTASRNTPKIQKSIRQQGFYKVSPGKSQNSLVKCGLNRNIFSLSIGSARKVAHFGSWPSMER